MMKLYYDNNKMDVVNVKVAYIRPKYNTLKDWMDDPNNVYIGRAGIVFVDGVRFPKSASIFANPFKIGKLTRDEVLIEYERYIRQKLLEDAHYAEELLKLRGKHLGCWCKPEPCHGDILIKILNERL